jgi:hypothetical protein
MNQINSEFILNCAQICRISSSSGRERRAGKAEAEDLQGEGSHVYGRGRHRRQLLKDLRGSETKGLFLSARGPF